MALLYTLWPCILPFKGLQVCYLSNSACNSEAIEVPIMLVLCCTQKYVICPSDYF
jgi:hypothetical protein